MKKHTGALKESKLTTAILTKKNWHDLEFLFGEKGACGGCWCMNWRLPRIEYQRNKGEKNKQLLHKLVSQNEPLGVIAYYDKIPVGWCSISSKTRLLEQKNSRILKKTAIPSKWSIVCLYIRPDFRRKHLSSYLIEHASAFAFKKGALMVEAYPVIPKTDTMPDVFAWTGIWKSYKRAGFKIVEQPSSGKYIMSLKK